MGAEGRGNPLSGRSFTLALRQGRTPLSRSFLSLSCERDRYRMAGTRCSSGPVARARAIEPGLAATAVRFAPAFATLDTGISVFPSLHFTCSPTSCLWVWAVARASSLLVLQVMNDSFSCRCGPSRRVQPCPTPVLAQPAQGRDGWPKSQKERRDETADDLRACRKNRQ